MYIYNIYFTNLQIYEFVIFDIFMILPDKHLSMSHNVIVD